MTLKKPTDFFSDGEDGHITINEDASNIDELIKKPELKSFSESFDVYKNNLEKFSNFSQTIEVIENIKKELQDSLKKEDLDNAMLAYTFLLEESISKVKNDFVEIEIPKKYNKLTVESELRALKHYQKFKEELDVLIEDIKENKIFLDDTVSNLEGKIDDISTINYSEIYQLDKLEQQNYKLSKKITYIEEVFEKFNENNILNESIIVEPSNSDNSDPLTPLDKNYVTFKELENHYRLFVNRIQQQLSTFGGGGETRLKYLDDIVGIATNASALDGKFLKYTHSIGKFEFATVSGGGGGGGISGITIREEGSAVGTANSIRDINFISNNLTASASGIGATITLSDTPTFTSTVIGSGVTINSSGINVTGIITATSFDGSLSSSDLDNSSVSYGGVTVSLGGTDATPAFNLSDAINYPYTSLTGITTSIVGDTTPQLGGNLDLNSKFITGTGGVNVTGVVTATSFIGSGTNLTGLTGASAATYGDASNVAQIVVDANGRITGISEVTISGGGGGSPGGSDGQIQYNNGGAFGGATQLFYDDSNNRVGINSTTPTEALDVIGSVKATDFNTTSDQNLKDNIKTIENPLSKVLSIRGVNFEWKDSNKASAGVIAQEIEKVLPELVTGQNTKTVNYNGLIGLLIETVKEQQKQIDVLNEKISKLE